VAACCMVVVVNQGLYRPWKVLESPGIKMLRFPGLESPGKGIGPGKPWKSPGILK